MKISWQRGRAKKNNFLVTVVVLFMSFQLFKFAHHLLAVILKAIAISNFNTCAMNSNGVIESLRCTEAAVMVNKFQFVQFIKLPWCYFLEHLFVASLIIYKNVCLTSHKQVD